MLEIFDPTKAGGTGEGRSVQADYTYLHVDLQGQTIPDGAALQTLREGHLFEQADPDRSVKERRKRRAAQAAAAGRTQSREDRNEQRRIDLLHNLGQAVSTVKNLIIEAADFPNPLKEHPMGSRADWQKVREGVRALEDLLIDVRPPAEPHPGQAPDADRTKA